MCKNIEKDAIAAEKISLYQKVKLKVKPAQNETIILTFFGKYD